MGGIEMFPGILVPIVIFFGLSVVLAAIISDVER
jgi:hypothetical protein